MNINRNLSLFPTLSYNVNKHFYADLFFLFFYFNFLIVKAKKSPQKQHAVLERHWYSSRIVIFVWNTPLLWLKGRVKRLFAIGNQQRGVRWPHLATYEPDPTLRRPSSINYPQRFPEDNLHNTGRWDERIIGDEEGTENKSVYRSRKKAQHMDVGENP